MARPAIGHNPELNRHFMSMLDQQLAKQGDHGAMAGAVNLILLKHYAFRSPDLTEVACRLNMTSRTLQRKLADEGTTFQRVANTVKRAPSIGMLANKQLTVAEVAYKPGYSDPAAFQRAFQHWTGHTPKRFRLSL